MMKPLKSITVLAFAACLICCFGCDKTVEQSATEQASVQDLPQAKQTTLGLYVTSKEAFEKWTSNPEELNIIDVRTPEEYLFIGHAAMAWNVPVFFQSYEWDAEKQQFPMEPNPNFIQLMTDQFQLTDTLMVTCRSGGRSAYAVNQLAKAGFVNVYNITDGVEGDELHDPGNPQDGKHVINGWKNSGNPWTYEVDPKKILFKSENH